MAFSKMLACGCTIIIDVHHTIKYCDRHSGAVNAELYKLAQMFAMWDGDAPTYTAILRRAYPLVKQLLEDPEVVIN